MSKHVSNLVKIPWHLLTLSSGKQKYGHLGQITPSKFDEIYPFAIPCQISTISIYIPNLVKINWCLLMLSSRNEDMGVSQAYNSVKKLTKFAHQQSQTRSTQYQYTYQVWSKYIDVYSSYMYHPEMKNKWMDRWLDTRTSNMQPQYLATY